MNISVGKLAVHLARDLSSTPGRAAATLRNAIDRDGFPATLTETGRKRMISGDELWKAYAVVALTGTVRRPFRVITENKTVLRKGVLYITTKDSSQIQVRIPDWYLPQGAE